MARVIHSEMETKLKNSRRQFDSADING